tara:strand:+ start:24520 stop:24930 length:411 start_codon:yes stop_codon:yes gene_type:complete
MNKENLKQIYVKYNLDKEDIFTLKFGNTEKHIITRSGVEKIQNTLGIECNYKIEKLSEDHKSCIILATGCIFKIDDKGQKVPAMMLQSFGEVSPNNNKSPYPISICEKRALARVVIKMSGLYGIHSEDEAEDFKKQ